jgi:AAHS family 4-hydroxybenzoate transporter-like MFS transporter
MNGAQTSMPILAASYYPTHGRASGVAWMLGIGRFGGIIGAAAGGPLLQAGYGIVSILEMLAVPALIAAIALLLKDRRAVAPVEQQAAT